MPVLPPELQRHRKALMVGGVVGADTASLGTNPPLHCKFPRAFLPRKLATWSNRDSLPPGTPTLFSLGLHTRVPSLWAYLNLVPGLSRKLREVMKKGIHAECGPRAEYCPAVSSGVGM